MFAHEGVNTGGANGISWISIDGPPDADNRLPVTNLHDIGRKAVPRCHGRVEAELVHPLVRGADIRRWSAYPSVHILFVQDPAERRGIAATTMAERYRGALDYLSQFEGDLRRRAAFRRYFTRRRSAEIVETGPYWSMFNVGAYTMAPHKVVWKDQTSDFAAAVPPVEDPVPLPNHKVMLVECRSSDEAHYLCAVLNSTPARLVINSYVVETQISTHPVKYVHIPEFDPALRVHKQLVAASRAAHKAVERGTRPNQERVDRVAASIWGLTDEELSAMRSFASTLRKRDLVTA